MVALPASSPFPRLQICLAVVVHDGQVLEKPADRDEVRANIKKYAVSAAFSVPYTCIHTYFVVGVAFKCQRYFVVDAVSHEHSISCVKTLDSFVL